MKECHARPGPPMAKQAPASPRKAVPKFVSLPSKYKLKDHHIYPQAPQKLSTDEEEFELYKNAPVSREDTDLIEFWEVCVVYLQCFWI